MTLVPPSLPRDVLDRVDPGAFSLRALVALALHEKGAPMDIEELSRRIERTGRAASVHSIQKCWGGMLPIRRTAGGKLALVPDLVRHGPWWRIEFEVEHHLGTWDPARPDEWGESRREWYRRARKLAVHCLFDRAKFLAAVSYDPDRREFADRGDREGLLRGLEAAEVVIGLDAWTHLDRLGFDPGPRSVVDLRTPIRTRKTVLAATVGIERPPSRPALLRRLWREGHRTRVFRDLRAELQGHWLLYEYGCLNDGILFESGRTLETDPVFWNVGARPRLYEMMQRALSEDRELEVVVTRPPRWSDPWSDAVRVRVESDAERHHLRLVESQGRERSWERDEVLAARLHEP